MATGFVAPPVAPTAQGASQPVDLPMPSVDIIQRAAMFKTITYIYSGQYRASYTMQVTIPPR